MDTIALFPPIVLLEIRRQPGRVVPIHDHRHYNSAIACVGCTLRCRNFDIVVPPDMPLHIAAGDVPPKGGDLYRAAWHGFEVPAAVSRRRGRSRTR